jgi:hypothetical protein
MRLVAVLLALAMLAGCAHTHTSVNAGAVSGTTSASASVSVHGHSNSLAALVIAGMFIAAAADYARDPYPPPSFAEFADWFGGPPPPREMAEGRRINEQDCTKPIEEAAGNLRCR